MSDRMFFPKNGHYPIDDIQKGRATHNKVSVQSISIKRMKCLQSNYTTLYGNDDGHITTYSYMPVMNDANEP